jgi:hypothetical protein
MVKKLMDTRSRMLKRPVNLWKACYGRMARFARIVVRSGTLTSSRVNRIARPLQVQSVREAIFLPMPVTSVKVVEKMFREGAVCRGSIATRRGIRTEWIIAAILIVSVVGTNGTTPQWIVRRYAETLQELRGKGGYANPLAALP